MHDTGGPAFEPEFYARDTVDVARALLGCVLETEVGGRRTSGRITEVEAYVGPEDPAAHGFDNRRTARNAAMFGPPGRSYIYFIYGMHWCFNAVTERIDFPAAVLIRALEPLDGVEVMADRRDTTKPKLLCSGPARLCQALAIDRSLNEHSLTEGPVRILKGKLLGNEAIGTSPRIGIRSAADWPLRFFERGSEWLSRRES